MTKTLEESPLYSYVYESFDLREGLVRTGKEGKYLPVGVGKFPAYMTLYAPDSQRKESNTTCVANFTNTDCYRVTQR